MSEDLEYKLPDVYQEMHEEVLDEIRTKSEEDARAIWAKYNDQVYENNEIPQTVRKKLEIECIKAIDETDGPIIGFATRHADSA